MIEIELHPHNMNREGLSLNTVSLRTSVLVPFVFTFLSPPSTEVKNVWSYTSTSPIRLHDMVLSLSTGTTLSLPTLMPLPGMYLKWPFYRPSCKPVPISQYRTLPLTHGSGPFKCTTDLLLLGHFAGCHSIRFLSASMEVYTQPALLATAHSISPISITPSLPMGLHRLYLLLYSCLYLCPLPSPTHFTLKMEAAWSSEM
jgi:hypothetical protein